jgi:DNA-binding response OmpR family regulator
MAELPLILVVEDEYLLQADIERALTDGGFATELFFLGEEALSRFVDRSKDYHALVTDVRLRGRVNGWEVARRIREKEPAFPVIYGRPMPRIGLHRACPIASSSQSHSRQPS